MCHKNMEMWKPIDFMAINWMVQTSLAFLPLGLWKAWTTANGSLVLSRKQVWFMTLFSLNVIGGWRWGFPFIKLRKELVLNMHVLDVYWIQKWNTNALRDRWGGVDGIEFMVIFIIDFLQFILEAHPGYYHGDLDHEERIISLSWDYMLSLISWSYIFVHLFNKYLLSSYHVPGTVVGVGDCDCLFSMLACHSLESPEQEIPK